jgi:signal peptidase
LKEGKKSSVGQIIVNVIGVILCVVFIPIIILNSVLIVRSFTDPDHIPSVFGVSPVIVLSGSMHPTFDAGDMILIQEKDPDALKVGDVICFIKEDSETAVTHRIVEVTESEGRTAYVTQGDFTMTPDRVPVYPEEVEGVYTGTIFPGLGNVAVFLQTPLGIIVFVACPVLLFFLWDLLRRALDARKKAGEKEAMEAELARLRQEVSKQQNTSDTKQ